MTENTPKPKVVAATVGAGVGSALATITAWVLEASIGIDIPNEVELAGGVVLTAAVAFAAGWIKRDNSTPNLPNGADDE